MGSDMGKMDFGVLCPKCGKKIAAKLGRLTKGAVLKCPQCHRSIKIRDDSFQGARRTLEKFGRSPR